jgi:hypothetical protein
MNSSDNHNNHNGTAAASPTTSSTPRECDNNISTGSPRRSNSHFPAEAASSTCQSPPTNPISNGCTLHNQAPSTTVTTSPSTCCKMEVNMAVKVPVSVPTVKSSCATMTASTTASSATTTTLLPALTIAMPTKKRPLETAEKEEETITSQQPPSTNNVPKKKQQRKNKGKKLTYASLLSTVMTQSLSQRKRTKEQEREDLLQSLGGGNFLKVQKI